MRESRKNNFLRRGFITESEIELDEGKTLFIKLVAIGQENQDGEVTVYFELNGPTTLAEEETDHPTNTFEQKFVCSKACENTVSENTTDRVVKELTKLASTYKDLNEKWRAFGYEKAISAIKRNPGILDNPLEISKVPGLGAKMASKIMI